MGDVRTQLHRQTIAALLLLPIAAKAQEVAVGHTGARSAPLDAAKLAALPATDVVLTYGTPPAPHTFHGPLLWTILTTTGAADPARHSDAVRQILYVTGSDHYVAVIAAGELSPEFENKQVILALTQDGHPSPTPASSSPATNAAAAASTTSPASNWKNSPKPPLSRSCTSPSASYLPRPGHEQNPEELSVRNTRTECLFVSFVAFSLFVVFVFPPSFVTPPRRR